MLSAEAAGKVVVFSIAIGLKQHRAAHAFSQKRPPFD